MSAPITEWSATQFNEWTQRVKEAPEKPRRDRLLVIASGPCNRDDVQAARRLLCKPRYAKEPG